MAGMSELERMIDEGKTPEQMFTVRTAHSHDPAESSPVVQFLSLSDYEKEAIWRELDHAIDPSQTRPMTAAERRQWKNAKRKPGRPRLGKGTAVVSITVEKDLLRWVDAYAKKVGLSRARLIGSALESMRDNVRRYRLISDAFEKKSGRNGERGQGRVLSRKPPV